MLKRGSIELEFLNDVSSSTAFKVLLEIVKTVNSNPKILEYIKSGKADHFGFNDDEELWEDKLLFRTHKHSEFECCIDYIRLEDDTVRADLLKYVLYKLRTIYQDLKDEEILEQVREYINNFPKVN